MVLKFLPLTMCFDYFERNGPTMSGPTTSWRIAPMTEGSTEC